MIKNFLLILSCFLVTLSSCYYDVEEQLYPKSNSNCDSIKGVFSLEVSLLIDRQWKSCHNNGFASGGVNLEGYDNIKQATLNGTLLQSIKHESGVSPMPQGQLKLEPCSIKAVELWKNAGAPNN